MKSIMEEASSIIKAIEKGWAKAGSPKEFSVKIFEEPQKNFIGLTVKPAKIAIIFDQEKDVKPAEKHKHAKPAPRSKPQPAPQAPIAKEAREVKEAKEAKKAVEAPAPKEIKEVKETKEPDYAKASDFAKASTDRTMDRQDSKEPKKELQQIWTDQMTNAIKDWLKEFLKITDHSDISFTANADKYYLKINFSNPLHENSSKERQVFAALSLLLMQSLRKFLNRPLKGYKIILMRNDKPL